jgi:hypothetical protein
LVWGITSRSANSGDQTKNPGLQARIRSLSTSPLTHLFTSSLVHSFTCSLFHLFTSSLTPTPDS